MHQRSTFREWDVSDSTSREEDFADSLVTERDQHDCSSLIWAVCSQEDLGHGKVRWTKCSSIAAPRVSWFLIFFSLRLLLLVNDMHTEYNEER